MSGIIKVNPAVKAPLDPGFLPAALWNRAYRALVSETGGSERLVIALERTPDSVSVFETRVLPDKPGFADANLLYVERLVKALLWIRGGRKIIIGGSPKIFSQIKEIYSASGKRKFDYDIMGRRIYGKTMEVENCAPEKIAEAKEKDITLGGNFDGCRIGFDLGGSDRKCAAVMNGEVIFTEEITWDPYFQKDPSYHRDGINDSLKRAAAKLPRVDAIGGSSAGVYVNNQVRIASLFRGVSETDFDARVRNMFFDLKKEWGDIPFEVVNDGEVTALAGALSMNDNSVLGVSLGTSMAGGYVTPSGKITDWLNELAFAPVDYRDDAPADEWSGDIGCGVQYFSQQAVARLAPAAGIEFKKEMPFPERLVEVQKLMKDGDQRAAKIYESIGVYLAYTVAHYTDFYALKNLLILGRVTSGAGGDLIISTAENTLKREFPELSGKINFRTPDEKSKRHGQAVTAASLPAIKK
jgi:predicted NBD/HSP70 family sugar kinase